MLLVKQSDTAHPIELLMIDSSDHVSPKTGLTVTVAVSKNGAAFGAVTGTVAEVGNGIYKLTPSAADVGTLGELAIHATATGADPADALRQIVAFDPYAVADLGLSRLDASVGTRLASSGYTAPDNATITAIAGFVDTEVAAIKAKTDNLPASPAAVGSAMTLDLTQTVADVGGAANTLGGVLSLLRALANGKLTIVSGVLKLFGQNGTTQVGVDRTVTGDVPADATRQ